MKGLQLATALLSLLSIAECTFIQRVKYARGKIVKQLGGQCGPFHWDQSCYSSSTTSSTFQTSTSSSQKTSITTALITSSTTSTKKTSSAKSTSTKTSSTQSSSTSCKTFSASTSLSTSDFTNFNIYLDPINKPSCPNALYLTESATSTTSCKSAALHTFLDDRGQLLQRQKGDYHLFSTGINTALMPLQASSSIMADYFYWSLTNGALVWDNVDFQGGTAAFCTYANGTVWAYFKTTPPSDCSLVNLRVVPKAKCGK